MDESLRDYLSISISTQSGIKYFINQKNKIISRCKRNLL